jgi:hypothetical protein
VQSTHAAINFTFEHPSRAGPWFLNSNYLVLLETKDEKELRKLIQKCERQEIAHTVFREPDIGDEVTAVAIEPSPQTQKLVAKLPLLFKRNNYEQQDNNGHQSKNGQLYKKNSVRKKKTRGFQSGTKSGFLQRCLWTLLGNALGIKRLQAKKKGQGCTSPKETSGTTDQKYG